MATLTHERRHHRRRGPLPAPLVLAASLFAGMYLVALCLLWILDPDARPAPILLLAVPVVAGLAVVASSAAERWPSRFPRVSRELGNSSRLLAVTAVLLVAPAALLQLTAGDPTAADRAYVTAAGVEARGIAGACPPAAVPDAGLTDVAAQSPHAVAVDCLVWWGVARGSSDGGFTPEAVVTREQTAAMIAGLVDASDRSLPRIAPSRFDDVRRSAHQASINRLAEVDVMLGTSESTFAPGEPVSRGQLAALLVRAHEHVTGERVTLVGDAFVDDDGTAHELAIDRAAALGLLSGRTDGTFGPDEPVTRAQLASMLARALDAYVEADVASPPV